MAPTEYVVILHGLADTRYRMRPLVRHLAKLGYGVLNIGYPSRHHGVAPLIEIIHQKIQQSLPKEALTLHFVGYSLGGLLVRGLIHRHPPQQLGRVVQIAPPNHGSEVASFLKRHRCYSFIFGPAAMELGIEDAKQLAPLLGKVTYPLGVIAGNRWIDPLCALLLPSPHDGKVSVESTLLEGMKAHIVLPFSHFFLPRHKETARQVGLFLAHATFDTRAI
jgi:pimeloyl-ACP methyl ester carboxylesterase